MHAAAIRRPRTAAAPPDTAAVARTLLAWYRRARRDLPWRRSSDPYAIWVSEIMLQQTQVERVREYFTRFLARFPDVESLAAARVDDVLRHWEGLGYYRRGRHLHEAARRIVADHGGRMPRSVEALRSLPGIGRYTAGAIASIAFNAREPVVEANSRRVITRLFAHDRPLGVTGGDEPIWRIAAALVPARGAGRFNQALMDLGAMVCTPTRPLCGTCPLASLCLAHQTGRAAEIPRRAGSGTIVAIRETAVVVRKRDRVLVVRRREGEWWSGLWDFPRLPGSGRTVSAAIARCDLLGRLGCTAVARLGTLAHSVTRHRIRLDVVTCTARRPGTAAAGRRWVRRGELVRLAMSSPGRRIARLIGD